MIVHIVDWDNTGAERTEAMRQGRMLTFCGLRIGDIDMKNWTHPEFAVHPSPIWHQFQRASCEACMASLAARALQHTAT